MVSDSVVLAMITAIPPTLLALATLIVSINNSRKADVIAGHVNGSAAAAAADAANLRKQIETMAREAADKREIAAVLAQAHTAVVVAVEKVSE